MTHDATDETDHSEVPTTADDNLPIGISASLPFKPENGGLDHMPDAAESVSWSKLMYLSAHGTGLPAPDLTKLGLAWIHEVCDRLWSYSRADFEPDITVPSAESQWRETCMLAGSIAESLMLATATFVEVAWHQAALEAGAEPLGMALGQRHQADTVCETVIGVGHRLVNFVARVMRTDPQTRDLMAEMKSLKPLGSDYVPFRTELPEAWLSLNESSLSRLRSVASPKHTKAHVALLKSIVELEKTPAWTNAFNHRAENFHRWRREHEYVSGVDAGTGAARDVLDYKGRVTGKRFGSKRGKYTAAEGLGTRVVADARSALEATARAADDTLTALLGTLPDLTGGYRLEITPTGVRKSRTRGVKR
ncbi:hypothetical protein IU501_27095 [Nocardia otitidiscaviarum]|uniref:hypothetical protein n=1 Tax=Nocardia otitidiscaviarum TaxID=1823 RepID=UPI0004A6B5B1|nr:hypothetical protein [Nocardia otitidiscaviarum]MBF6136647.1 hypothetical protein [Nocardia otitidiscaviarum]MBF6484850.1 hypothetical protein [Nocardia otitidiscaviarum]